MKDRNIRPFATRLLRTLVISAMVVMALAAILYRTPVGAQVNHAINLTFANATARLADACGIPSVAHGTSVIGPHATLAIIDECNPLSAWLFMITILAMVPMSRGHRAYRTVQTTLICTVANQARLCLLHWVINFRPEWWSYVHGPPMQALFTLMILSWMLHVVLEDTSLPDSQPLSSHA